MSHGEFMRYIDKIIELADLMKTETLKDKNQTTGLKKWIKQLKKYILNDVELR